MERFFENLFKRKLRKTKRAYNKFLRDFSLPTLSQEEKKFVTKKLVNIHNKEIDYLVEINKELERFFENLFKRKLRKTKHAYNEFLRDILLLTLSQEEKKICDEEISKEEVILAMKSLSNNKSPGNDGLTKEFCDTF